MPQQVQISVRAKSAESVRTVSTEGRESRAVGDAWWPLRHEAEARGVLPETAPRIAGRQVQDDAAHRRGDARGDLEQDQLQPTHLGRTQFGVAEGAAR